MDKVKEYEETAAASLAKALEAEAMARRTAARGAYALAAVAFDRARVWLDRAAAAEAMAARLRVKP